ncbi:MAG: NAD(P)/FAD-dependent oxidoreductase [Actinobacteria bacterium]|nr:NAD(P)/FAD-dependent oxidoreductase [Actinomycetota bacterium]
MPTTYDAIVIGGGHNGLAAGALLAKGGARTVVLEARHKTGGATATDTPWPDAPDYKVTTYSYVMSLMPEKIVNELQLSRHGYKVYPMGPYYLAFPDGTSLCMGGGDDAADHEAMARFSKKDADAYPQWRRWMQGIAEVLAPLLMTVPPKVGSRRPSDLADQLKTAWRFRGLGVKGVGDVTRLMTMSISDLLDEWFESPHVKASLAIDGVIGTWAGPASPGTAYVMAHHEIGDAGVGLGSWGFPEGGMGAVADAVHRSAESFGAEVRCNAPVDTIVAATHPAITFLEQVARVELPEDFVTSIERWKTRSGTVKINLALAELPNFTANPGSETQLHHGGAIELAHSVDYIERAFQDAREGRPARRPFSDGVIPTVFDKTLCPDGHHIMSLFTQWVPYEWAREPHRNELEAYADRVIDGYNELAPNFKSSIMHRQVIGPYDMETEIGLKGGNIFHGELSVDQLFHMRPAPGFADYRSPIKGLYQASSATHAGGGVCAVPAWNCVKQIRRDNKRGLRRRST